MDGKPASALARNAASSDASSGKRLLVRYSSIVFQRFSSIVSPAWCELLRALRLCLRCLARCLARFVKRDCRMNQGLKRIRVEFLAFVNVDCAPRIAVET